MADEKVLETVTPEYDDAALEAEFLEKRKAQIEADCAQPIDPEGILEVRHLRKCFPIK